MNENIELLNYIYQNSEMGCDTIAQLLNITEDKEFIKQLNSELNEYKKINEISKNHLKKYNEDEKGISKFQKIKAYLMINFETLIDKSTPNIAEMMIIGSNMGVINAIKNIKKYKLADSNIVELMDTLKKFEEKNIETLKTFL